MTDNAFRPPLVQNFGVHLRRTGVANERRLSGAMALRPPAEGGCALPRLDPRLDRLPSEPDGATEADVREPTGANLPVHPVGPHAQEVRNVVDLKES